MPGTRKLGRTTAHRKAMLRGMVTLLLKNGQIETTLTRAKEVRSMAEKMITLGKKNTLASRRAALAYTQGRYTNTFRLNSENGCRNQCTEALVCLT